MGESETVLFLEDRRRHMLPRAGSAREAPLFSMARERQRVGNSMAGHDPLRFTNDLSFKLASRSRHVCLFLGAGTSRACGLPEMSQLQESVVSKLDEGDADHLRLQLKGRNLEQALSRVRRVAALLEGSSELEGLTRQTAADLDRNICQAIVEQLSTETASLDPVIQLAAWAAHADYHWPLEIFTINYDLLVEMALERLRLPYFDGFVGNIQARFHTDLVEGTPEEPEKWLLPSFIRLWKLHGSVNWVRESEPDDEILRLGAPIAAGSVAAIYPSDAKYDESRRMPFLVLQDRFRRALAQAETLTFVTGYSFSDEHLNEILFDAATRRPRSEIVVFCFSEIPEVLKNRAQLTPNLQAVTQGEAVIGGRLAAWEEPPEDLLPADFWENGQFTLGDFGRLAHFLARSSALPRHEESNADEEPTNA